MSNKERWALILWILPFGGACVGLSLALIFEVSASYWIPTLVWTVGLFVWMGIMGAAGWLPRTADDEAYARGDVVFCEGYERGWIKQPISVWSDLAFIAAGLIIVLVAGSRSVAGPNPMATPGAIEPLLYGLIVIFMGPGSMVFHASMKDWAGWFDNMSIILWAAFSLSYTVARLVVAAGGGMWPLWLLAPLIVVGVGLLTAFRPGSRRLTQILTAGVWVAIELVVMIVLWTGGSPGFVRSTPWFLATLLAFAAAFACWLPSGAVWRWWCNHRSPLQGHGFWHLFAAVGALFVYFYFASESP